MDEELAQTAVDWKQRALAAEAEATRLRDGIQVLIDDVWADEAVCIDLVELLTQRS